MALMNSIKKIKIKTTSPLDVRMTLEQHGWTHDFTVNDVMTYKCVEPRKVPVKVIPYKKDNTPFIADTHPIPTEELEERCKNAVSFFPNPGNFLGPVRKRLHNMMQGLPHPDDRKFVEEWIEENYPLKKIEKAS